MYRIYSVAEVLESTGGGEKVSLPDLMTGLAGKGITGLPPGGGLWSK